MGLLLARKWCAGAESCYRISVCTNMCMRYVCIHNIMSKQSTLCRRDENVTWRFPSVPTHGENKIGKYVHCSQTAKEKLWTKSLQAITGVFVLYIVILHDCDEK